MSEPDIFIIMFTYNHEKYIAKAIEGVLMQNTSYKYKLFIGEDSSTDNTRSICVSYAEKYPDKIEVVSTKQNNIKENARNIWDACFKSGAKYVAICEGDDYWIDPDKLQKQVDFLEKNNDYSICFTSIAVVDELENKNYVPAAFLNFINDTYTVEDIIFHPPDKPLSLPMMTWVFRNVLPNPMPEFYLNALQGDTVLSLLLGDKGKFKFLPEKTAAYRQHSGGITKSKEFQLRFDRSMFDLFDSFNEYTHHKYHEVIKKRLYPLSQSLLMYGSSFLKGKERRKHILRMIIGYNKYRPSFNAKEIAYYNMVLFFPFVLKIHKFLSKK